MTYREIRRKDLARYARGDYFPSHSFGTGVVAALLLAPLCGIFDNDMTEEHHA
jgi:hypothetical protein